MTIFDAIKTGDLATVSQMLVDDPTLANQYIVCSRRKFTGQGD